MKKMKERIEAKKEARMEVIAGKNCARKKKQRRETEEMKNEENKINESPIEDNEAKEAKIEETENKEAENRSVRKRRKRGNGREWCSQLQRRGKLCLADRSESKKKAGMVP